MKYEILELWHILMQEKQPQQKYLYTLTYKLELIFSFYYADVIIWKL
jgi:hypothetical protein